MGEVPQAEGGSAEVLQAAVDRLWLRWYLDEFEDVQNPPELGCAVLGHSEKAFWQRLARAQSDLVKARTAALERDRPAPAYRDLRIVGRSWGAGATG